MSGSISRAFVRVAVELEGLPPPNGYKRYIPFLKELAARDGFCSALHRLIPELTPVSQVLPDFVPPQIYIVTPSPWVDRELCRELISSYRLPDKGPYCVDNWLDLFEGVWRTGRDERLSPLTEVHYRDISDSSSRLSVGVEFEFEFPGERGKHVVYTRDIQLKKDVTRAEAGNTLWSELQPTL